MPTIDVTGAPDRLLANKTVTPGHCLEYVSRAIRDGEAPLDWDGLDTALDCWENGCGDKHTSRNVPLGFPAFLGSKRSSNAGDVIISLGNGKFAATDWPGWGVVGICTLEQREAQTGRKYLGYAGEFLGYTLTSTATASLDIERITEKDDDMLIYVSTSTSKDGVIPKGFSFIQDASGPLRPLSAAEWGAYDYWRAHGIPVRVAEWTGDMIRAVTVTVGLRQWSALGDNNPVLTGRIIYADPAKADYPRMSVDGSVIGAGLSAAQIAAEIVKLIPAGATPAAIAKAVNDDAAKRLAA